MAIDLTIILENRPGTIADVGEALAAAGVNLLGGCGFPCEGVGVMHLLIDDGDVDAARQAVERAGFEVRDQREVVVTEIEDRTGALGQLARRLANAGVNVDLLYLATDTRVVLGPDNLDKARKAL